MKVKNRKCIRKLSMKSLWASRKRNLIAIFAIALTTLLFTSLFTIVLSINSSFETYQFRQVGGYCHGTFKDVTEDQIKKISAHSLVKETGARKVIGFCDNGVFSKVPAEVSYMDKNCTKWSYATPTTGRAPKTENEIAMDTGTLKLLGITPKLGEKIPLSFTVGTKNERDVYEQTDEFTLVGYWDYDDIMPVHYINISKDYADKIEQKGIAGGMDPFRIDLNVMMSSSVNIEGQMQQVDTDLGYNWETFNEENSVRIGVNWGYTTSQINSSLDPEMIASMAAFLCLIIFTGYLIIYNIFQISVSSDIRFYGLLKTIGTTPRQLKRLIRLQALFLSIVGIPVGMIPGYLVGIFLTPVAMESTTLAGSSSDISTSPVIFIGSALFSLVTVLISCSKPGRMAAKVSPVEATKYTEAIITKKKSKTTRGAKVHQMAFANLFRSKKKTLLVVLSLALSVTLLNALFTFVSGFSMEKYTSSRTCADFVVSSPDYFRFTQGVDEYISQESIEDINNHAKTSLSGSGYTMAGEGASVWLPENVIKYFYGVFDTEEEVEQILSQTEHQDNLYRDDFSLIEGLDQSLLEKLNVVKGDISPLSDKRSHNIALVVNEDDYGNIVDAEKYPEIGETIPITYTDEGYYIDNRTGGKCDETTPDEYLEWYTAKAHKVDYTLCALVTVPYAMSYRYKSTGCEAILEKEVLEKDSGQPLTRLFYLFDTPDQKAEAEAESYLADLTKSDLSPLMYESKAKTRAEFKQFQQMFLILGGLLCAIIGLIGVLNFFNAIMTGIITRKREFAVLKAVGMTNRQLKQTLICEGLFYALGSILFAFILSLILNPLLGNMLSNMFWFFDYQFTIIPIICMIPIFVLLGFSIPFLLYGQAAKQSIVEQLSQAE